MSLRMMQHFVAMILAVSMAGTATAQPWVTWPGNGHQYAVISAPQGISWTDAAAGAQALGGTLATITSADENQFVFSLIDDAPYWRGHLSFTGTAFNIGPWIGGFQPDGSPEPNGGWQWTTGEPFVYSAWFIGEPNNGPIPGEVTENRTCFWVRGSLTDRGMDWNDYHDGGCWDGDCVVAYVVERACSPLTLQGPAPRAVCAGQTATFDVTPTGFGTISYAWRRDGQPMMDGPTVSGIDGPTLTITAAGLGDVGDYDCIVTDNCGPVTSMAAALAVFTAGSGDGDGSGAVDGLDIAGFVAAAGGPPAASAGYCAYDMDGNGVVDAADLPGFLVLLVGP